MLGKQTACRIVGKTNPLVETQQYTNGYNIYRIRAVAGIGSACGLGASPTPDLRESARAVPRTRKYRRAARPG
jgi:hypothetical protein